MHELGGRGRATQIETWKGTTWIIDLKQNEIVLKSRKRKQENVLAQNQVKRIAQMKADLGKYQQLLKAANAKLTKAEETNARLTSSLTPSVPKHNKSWSEYSTQYKRKSTALKFTDNTFFQPVRIDLVNKESNELPLGDKDGSIT